MPRCLWWLTLAVAAAAAASNVAKRFTEEEAVQLEQRWVHSRSSSNHTAELRETRLYRALCTHHGRAGDLATAGDAGGGGAGGAGGSMGCPLAETVVKRLGKLYQKPRAVLVVRVPRWSTGLGNVVPHLLHYFVLGAASGRAVFLDVSTPTIVDPSRYFDARPHFEWRWESARAAALVALARAAADGGEDARKAVQEVVHLFQIDHTPADPAVAACERQHPEVSVRLCMCLPLSLCLAVFTTVGGSVCVRGT